MEPPLRPTRQNKDTHPGAPSFLVNTGHYQMIVTCMHEACGSSMMEIIYSKPVNSKRIMHLRCLACGKESPYMHIIAEERRRA